MLRLPTPVIFTTDARDVEELTDVRNLTFLVIPSFTAGVFLGINNYFLGYISTLGIAAAMEFSLGAFTITTLIKVFIAIKNKSLTGSYFPFKTSNFFKKDPDTGNTKIKWENVLGICLRPCCNMSF